MFTLKIKSNRIIVIDLKIQTKDLFNVRKLGLFRVKAWQHKQTWY